MRLKRPGSQIKNFKQKVNVKMQEYTAQIIKMNESELPFKINLV